MLFVIKPSALSGRDFRLDSAGSSVSDLPPLVLLTDFDGTITEVDTCEAILDKFSKEDWRRYDRLLEAGAITLEECMKSQLGAVKASEKELLRAVVGIKIRPGFKEYVGFCRQREFELVIVSAGLDFVIRRMLGDYGVEGLRIVAPKAAATPTGIQLEFPRIDGKGEDFKVQLINSYQESWKRAFLVGDGESDHAAALKADYVFAVKGYSLASFCKKKHLAFTEINNFYDVLSSLERTT